MGCVTSMESMRKVGRTEMRMLKLMYAVRLQDDSRMQTYGCGTDLAWSVLDKL